MSRIRIAVALVVAFTLTGAATCGAAKVTNAYGNAASSTRGSGVEVSVTIAPQYQQPGANPFDVEVICVDASGMYKWLLTLKANEQATLTLMGHVRSASYYGVDSQVDPGVSFSLALPPPLVNPDDRLLVSIDDGAIAVSGPIFTVAIDVYNGQPLRMDTLRVALTIDENGALVATATNLTHVPLFVPLASLVLGLAPTPDWIPDGTPDIRWTPDPALSQEILVIGADETVRTVLPLPAIPAASAAAYKSAVATLYAGIVDLYPGDYLAVGFPVAWGISWSYLPVVVP
jgi:hypothetical protein